MAFEIDSGVDGLSLRWDNTFRYNIGTRVEKRDPRISGNANYDEGDYRFGSGDLITNRLDILTELEAEWKNTFGARVSAQGWYDDAYSNTHVRQNPNLPVASSYTNAVYSDFTKRYYTGPSGEFLDAFVYANLQLGKTPLNIKVGKHTVYWGTALFSQGGIAYSQQPIDGRKGAATPGTEVRETFLPLTQVSAQSQLTPWLSVAAQYYLDWDHVRAPEGGTYLGGVDFTLEGPQQAGGGLPFSRGATRGPSSKSGNWGVNAKWTVAELEGTTFGLYYRHFDEKNGLWLFRDPSSPLSYRAVFPRDTKLIGLSADTTLGPFGVGAEITTRRNAGLTSTGFALADDGARGNTWHALANAIYTMPSTFIAPTGSVAAEVTYDYLDKVTKNPVVSGVPIFKGDGTAACPLGKFDGCATKTAFGFNLKVSPQYPQLVPGIDLTVPLSFGGGLKGNTADFGGTNERAYAYSAGLSLDINKRWLVDLLWADSIAKIIPQTASTYTGNGGWQTTDRGRVSLTIRTSL